GTSAGGLGVDCSLSQFKTKWPSTSLYSLNNSGAPLSNAYNTVIHTVSGPTGWGVWTTSGTQTVSATCPFTSFTTSTGDWSPDVTVSWNEAFQSTIRKALVDDYEDATMNGFSNLLGCDTNPNEQYACTREPHDTLVNLGNYIDSHAGNATFKEYYAPGPCHGE